MKRTMYDITAELDEARESAYAFAAENGGEIPDYLADTLDGLEGEKDQKAENIACAFKEIGEFIGDIAKEEKRLAARKKVFKNEMDRIKAYLLAFVEPGVKVKGTRAEIGWRTSTKTVLLDGVTAEDLPEAYQNIKTEIKANLTDLKAALNKADKDDELHSFAKNVTGKNIQIK